MVRDASAAPRSNPRLLEIFEHRQPQTLPKRRSCWICSRCSCGRKFSPLTALVGVMVTVTSTRRETASFPPPRLPPAESTPAAKTNRHVPQRRTTSSRKERAPMRMTWNLDTLESEKIVTERNRGFGMERRRQAVSRWLPTSARRCLHRELRFLHVRVIFYCFQSPPLQSASAVGCFSFDSFWLPNVLIHAPGHR